MRRNVHHWNPLKTTYYRKFEFVKNFYEGLFQSKLQGKIVVRFCCLITCLWSIPFMPFTMFHMIGHINGRHNMCEWLCVCIPFSMPQYSSMNEILINQTRNRWAILISAKIFGGWGSIEENKPCCLLPDCGFRSWIIEMHWHYCGLYFGNNKYIYYELYGRIVYISHRHRYCVLVCM